MSASYECIIALLELSPAAEVIANSVDLLVQILVCLPGKSLMRFKSVSKQWLSLISDSHFATKHYCQNPRPSVSGLFLSWKYSEENCKSVSLHGDPTGPTLGFLYRLGFQFRSKIIHSCNGLLLCVYSQFLCNLYTDHYLVCNPTTQRYTLIPLPPVFSSGCNGFLAFDPSKSPHYKVVFMGLYHYVQNPYVQIDIYCSDSASWKQIREPGRSLRHAVFCSGVIHWFGDEDVLLGFDVDSEKMIEMKEAPEIHSVDEISYFGECGGHLVLIWTLTPFSMEFRILEINKNYSSWIVKCMVNIGPLLSLYPQLDNEYSDYSILCVVKGEKEEDFALVLAIPGNVISYNVECKTWKVLRDVAPGLRIFLIFSLIMVGLAIRLAYKPRNLHIISEAGVGALILARSIYTKF